MKVQLIATDLDGTLIPYGKAIPEPVLDALQEALDQGIFVVPVTGRSYAAIPPEILSLSGLRYVISSNGAVILDLYRDQILNRTLIPAGEAAGILRKLKDQGIYSSVYSDNRIYNWSRLPSYLEQYYRPRMTIFRQNPRNDLADFLERNGLDVEKIFIAVHEEGMRETLRRDLQRHSNILLTSSSPWNLEVNHRNADKGTALRWLAHHLLLSSSEILAMGDNENDITMLQFAGISAAMENGTKEAKTAARLVIPDCEQAGAAEFLRKNILDR